MKNKSTPRFPSTKSTSTSINFDSTFVPSSSRSACQNRIRLKETTFKPASGGVYRASVTEKKKTNRKLIRCKTPIDRLSPNRGILKINKIFYPNMTNFDPETHNEIANEKDSSEVGYHLACNERESNSSNQRTEIDVTSMTYLRNTYSHLHENQFLKLNQLLSGNENEELKLKKKQRINLRKGLYNEKSMETEEDTYASEGSFSSENSSENNEISEITKDMKNIEVGSHSKSPAKPIITFTPVRTVDAELNQHFHSSISVDRPPSSGSSSPLLEVPVSEFGDISTEMMRPPING